MQHLQSPYGSRLRAFHARHGITPARGAQRRLKLLPPGPGGPPRHISLLRGVIYAVLGTVGLVLWLWFCVGGLGISEIPGNDIAQAPTVSR